MLQFPPNRKDEAFSGLNRGRDLSSQTKRQNDRHCRNESVTLELYLPDGDPSGKRMLLYTQTLDISQEGIKVRLAEDLPRIPVHSVTIEPLEQDIRFKLKGEVRWCTRLLDSVYEAGILILNDDSDQYNAWLAYVDTPPESHFVG